MAWYRQPVQPWTSVPRRRRRDGWSSVPVPGDGWSSLPAPHTPAPTRSAGPGLQITPNVDERPVIFDPNTLAPGYGPDPYAQGPPQYPGRRRDVVIGQPQGLPGGILGQLGQSLGQSQDWRTQIARMAAAFRPSTQLADIQRRSQEFQHNQAGPAEDAFRRLEHVATAQTAASRLAQLLAARRPSNGRIFGQ